MRKISTIRLGVVLLAFLVVLFFSACAPSGTGITIETSASPVNVNDTITVPVKVENISDLIAMEIHLSFDSSKLEVKQLKNGGFLKSDYIVQNTFDNTNGTLDYAVAQIGGSPAGGSGTLLEVVFRVKDKGEASISFRKTQAAPAGAIFSNSKGAAIQVSLINGNLTGK